MKAGKDKKKYSLDGIRRGNKLDFEVVYHDLYDRLYFLALSYIYDPAVSEDMVQESFLSLWENRETLKDNTDIHNYLYTITKNNCLNHLKHLEVVARNTNSMRISELRFLQESLNRMPGSFPEFSFMLNDLEKAVDNLPDNLKLIFKMSRYEDLTYARIAEKTGLSIKTVESRMSKALVLLKGVFKAYFFE